MEQVSLKAWGNSYGIRIPKEILKKLNIGVSDTLQMDVQGDSIIIRKAFKHKSFEERLDEYEGEISVCEFDWGDPSGKELL